MSGRIPKHIQYRGMLKDKVKDEGGVLLNAT